jgi:prevent-host-death family protein
MAEDRVNIAEFKRRMGAFMKRVRAGGTVVLLDRSEPVARLTRIDREPSRLRVIPPKRLPETLSRPTRVVVEGPKTSLDALQADREER